MLDYDEVLKNNYGGDMFSGATEVFASPEDDIILRNRG